MKQASKLTQFVKESREALTTYNNFKGSITEQLEFSRKWVQTHTTLFCILSVKPEGLPTLIACKFYNSSKVREFHKLFDETREGFITDDDLDLIYKEAAINSQSNKQLIL